MRFGASEEVSYPGTGIAEDGKIHLVFPLQVSGEIAPSS